MAKNILVGRGSEILEQPKHEWEARLELVPRETRDYLGFMSKDHHRVRYFVVRELVRTGVPVDPESIARSLRLSKSMVLEILRQLEQKLFFLVRNARGEVSWAFPVTAEPTPHRLQFRSGERLWAA